jgi:hypothetical protein
MGREERLFGNLLPVTVVKFLMGVIKQAPLMAKFRLRQRSGRKLQA